MKEHLKLVNPLNVIGITEFQINCVCVDESITNVISKPISFSSPVGKPPGSKMIKIYKFKLLNDNNKSFMKMSGLTLLFEYENEDYADLESDEDNKDRQLRVILKQG